MSSTTTRSILWNYFQKNGEFAKCITCRKEIRNCGNTTNLRNHIKSKHPNVYAEYEKSKSREVSLEETEIIEFDVEEQQLNEETISSFSTEEESPIQSQQTPTSSTSNNKDFVSTPASPVDGGTDRSPCQPRKKTKQVSLATYTLNKEAQDKIDKILAYFISVDMMPYNLVEKDGFKMFVRQLNPSYKIPSRKSITDKHIPRLYNETRLVLAKMIQNVTNFAFTTDCWTTNQNQPFIALTCHYVNDRFELQSVCLGCEELSEDHTGENIAECLEMFLLEWNMADKNKIVAFTTDYGSNVLKAVNECLNYVHICCFGHAINTAVSKSFQNDSLGAVLSKVKEIQRLFAHSWKAARELHDVQNKLNFKQTRIPSYSRTRWWSLLNLIKVVVEQELPLLEFLKTYKNGAYKKNTLHSDEFALLKDVIDVLDPIQRITDVLSGEKFVTASIIIPVMTELENVYKKATEDCETDIFTNNNETKAQIIQTILETLQRRYKEKTKTCEALKICTFLDPRFKGNLFEKEQLTELTQTVLEICTKIQCEVKYSAVLQKKKTGLSAILKTTKVNENEIPQEAETANTKIQNEIQRYLHMPALDADEDPLIWWRSNCDLYPHLCVIAKKYLCIQATSVASERIFSKGGNIITDLRSSLTTDHASQLIFLAMNKGLINIPP